MFDFFNRNSLAYKVRHIKKQIKGVSTQYSREKVWISQIGAYDINPKHLSFTICVKTDKEKRRLQDDSQLNHELRQILVDNGYPVDAIYEVKIGFESQETVDRESNGSWYYHFK